MLYLQWFVDMVCRFGYISDNEAFGLGSRFATMTSEDFDAQNRKLYDNLTTNEKDFGIEEGVPAERLALFFVCIPIIQ